MTDRTTDAKTDQAALMGVTLAAFLTIFLPEGPWGWFGTIVGVTLGLALLGYYRPIWSPVLLDVISKALALATVGALCFSVAIAFFVQEEWVRAQSQEDCEREVVNRFPIIWDERRIDGSTLGRTTSEFQHEQIENCLGDATSAQLPWVWLWTAVAIFIAYLSIWVFISWHKGKDFDWRHGRWY
jgi:hypothetical protein